MKAIAVIGMNFGDEGKGHIVNFLSDANTLNVRFNGGAQAAHAVFFADGRNHIFHQFGSGSMKGARTLFSSHMIVNPIFFGTEFIELTKKANLREVFIDPRCRISTIYDMLINEFTSYYHKKQNTTGYGINETIERSQFRQLRISMRDLIDKDLSVIAATLKTIREEYVPYRLDELSLPFPLFLDYCRQRIYNFEQTEAACINAVSEMLKCVVVWADDNLIDRYLAKDNSRKIVFEGAQGFRLDQNRKDLMPYLTRSNTGLQNVVDCLRMVRTPLDLNVYLVTRAYLTRHGEGPLWNELKKPYDNIEELTNIPNPYQGAMRYGFLNKSWYDQAFSEIREYINKNKPGCIKNIKIESAFTCLDHLDEGEIIYSRDEERDFIHGDLLDFSDISITSNGMLETDVRFYKK